MFSFQISVGSRRELVANSIHTADADATPTRLNLTVESRRRRRCVLGISSNIMIDLQAAAAILSTAVAASRAWPIRGAILGVFH